MIKKIKDKIKIIKKNISKNIVYATNKSIHYTFVLLFVFAVFLIIVFVFINKNVSLYKDLQSIKSDINIKDTKQINVKDFLEKVKNRNKADN